MTSPIIPLVTRNETNLVSTEVIAEQMSVEHASTIKLLRKYLSVIELRFGQVRFEIRPFETAGGVQERTIGLLTEDQSLALLALTKNSDVVVQLKMNLVEAFAAARKALIEPKPVYTRPLLPPQEAAAKAHEVIETAMNSPYLTDTERQVFKDAMINSIGGQALLDNPARLIGVVEMAEELGYKPTIRDRGSLGKFVKKALEVPPTKERRLMNGTFREANCWPHNTPGYQEAIHEFYN